MFGYSLYAVKSGRGVISYLIISYLRFIQNYLDPEKVK